MAIKLIVEYTTPIKTDPSKVTYVTLELRDDNYPIFVQIDYIGIKYLESPQLAKYIPHSRIHSVSEPNSP